MKVVKEWDSENKSTEWTLVGLLEYQEVALLGLELGLQVSDGIVVFGIIGYL